MKIYIASSWRNQHGVEMFTALLRENGHEVISWADDSRKSEDKDMLKKMPFIQWLYTERGQWRL